MGPYRVAASSTHSGVDSGWVGTEIASRASRAVLKPPTSFQMAKCGAGERQDRLGILNHSYYTRLILHLTPYSTLSSFSYIFNTQWLLTVGRVKVWRCPFDRKSLQDKSGSLLCICCPFGWCRCPPGKETGCHMQYLVMQHQNSYIHMNDSWLQLLKRKQILLCEFYFIQKAVFRF